MKTRNEIYGGTFSSPETPDTNANGELKKLVLSDSADITKNRSSWIRTIFYNIMDSFTHKTEDRATSANLGVSGAEPTTTKYVTVEQLPSVDKTTNNFTGSAGDGALINNQNTITISSILTGTAKQFVASLHTDFVAWLLARTWLQSDLVTLVNTTVNNPAGGGLIPVGIIWSYTGAHTVDPDGFLNLCNEYSGSARSISNTAGTGTLHNDKYQALFLHLWTNYGNTECPVSSGRGVSAAADWAANKDIKLPDYRGRVGGYYKNADANFGTLGKQIGTEILVASDLPVVSPYSLTGGQTQSSADVSGSKTVFALTALTTSNTPGTLNNGVNSPVINGTIADNTGGDQKHFQPTIIQTAIIKY